MLGLAVACGTPDPDSETSFTSFGPPPSSSASETDVSSDNSASATGNSESATGGSASATGSTSMSDDTTGEPPKFDLGLTPDTPPMECLECSITLASQQSGVLDVFGANVFATAQLEMQDVYALGTSGSGRFIAIADSSLPFNEMSDCPLTSWLAGGNESPAMMWFGWTPSDGPIGWNVPGAIDAGVHLPPQYIGNPALLAADFDIVMYLEASGQFDMGDEPSDAEMQTLLDYVQMHGGGAYVSSEFANAAGTAYMTPDDLDSVNRLMVPLGLESLQVSLNWGAANGNIDFECFPPPAG